MKINAIIIRKDRTLKILRASLSDNTFIFDDFKYVFDPQKQYLYRKFLTRKYYSIYIEGNPIPIDVEKLEDNIILKKLLKSHVISEWLKEDTTSFLWYILFMIFGMTIGVIIGLGAYPFVMHG